MPPQGKFAVVVVAAAILAVAAITAVGFSLSPEQEDFDQQLSLLEKSTTSAVSGASDVKTSINSARRMNEKKLSAQQKLIQDLKQKLKYLLVEQRQKENEALGVRREALRQWAEYKLNLDDAETVARESAKYSHAVMKFAKEAVLAKKKEQKWAKAAFVDLHKAMKEEIKHPEHIEPEHKLTLHEKYVAASDTVKDFDVDPFYQHHRKMSPMEKAEDELEQRVFAGDASKSEIRAYHELHRMHHWIDKKKQETFMGEAVEMVRKQEFGHKFDDLVSAATHHAKLAQKYTRMSSGIVRKAKAFTHIENKVFKRLKKLEKNPAGLQRVQRVVVQLVDPPK